MVNLFKLAVQWCAGFYWPNPMPDPMPRHFSSTGIFRPLERVEVLQPANHEPRRQYLITHAAGFAYARTLKKTSNVTVLIADIILPYRPISLSPTQFAAHIIIKQYHWSLRDWYPSKHHPSELEISTLSDPLVVRSLPPDLHVFPTLLSFQIYDFTPYTYRAALFYKYYNAGTLFDLIKSHNRRREPIPEILIWHVIARLTRAYSFLHMGSRTYQPDVADPNWEPIVHSDGHTANVFLHNPSPEEMREDGSGVLADVCRDGLPQVVLGEFGNASSYRDDRLRSVGRMVVAGAPEKATWRDKAQLGRVVMDMMGVKEAMQAVYSEELEGEAMRAVYSEELVSVVDVFRPLVRWLEVVQNEGTKAAGKTESERVVLAGFPTNEIVYGVLMGMADRKVEAYHAEKRRAEYEGLQKGVGASWVGFLGEKGL